jgi:predicted RNA-binding Zn-ribbon protein involved in translation (DUF1610 family)
VNSNNVVPFDFALRGMARRGAPDKEASRADGVLELECPNCRAVLRVEDARRLRAAILCADCDTAIPPLLLESGMR